MLNRIGNEVIELAQMVYEMHGILKEILNTLNEIKEKVIIKDIEKVKSEGDEKWVNCIL